MSDWDPPAGEESAPPPPARPRTRTRRSPLFITAVIVVIIGIVLTWAAGLWTQVLWFDSIGFRSVFVTELGTKILLGGVTGILTMALVASSIIIGYRTRPIYPPATPQQEALDRYREALDPLRRLVTIAAPAVVGVLVGLGAASQWQTYLLWRNAQPFGTKDPYFGMDIGFFVFTLPWLSFLVALLTVVLLAAAIAAGFTHYVYGGIQLTGRQRTTTSAARIHLSVLLAVLVLVRAVAYWLERFELSTQSSSLMTGVQYTGATAVMPAKAILAVASVICAGLFLAVIWTKTWRLPIVGVVLLVVTSVVVGGIYPALIQSLKVGPSEKTLEQPYLANNIAATRAAYGLASVKTTQYTPNTVADPVALRQDAATLPGIRLVDPNVVSSTFQQLQGLKGYYKFPDTLDVDRYTINGTEQDAIVAARELNLDGVPAAQRNWLNDHTVYTHGYGLVAAYGNRRGADGQPVFMEQDIPTQGVLGDFQPRIYYGESEPGYSIVGSPAGGSPRELDYPAAAGDQTYTYQGSGGVALSSLARRVAYALTFREPNFLLSNAVGDYSKILYQRNPRQRVQQAAPWLTLDGNEYPSVVDGRVVWIIDGFTTSANYPNSALTSLSTATQDTITQTRSSVAAITGGQINYIRNSVKATVDAYDGTVTLYAWDPTDPVLKAWEAAFPGTVKPRSAMSADLMSHVRYPEDLFKVQRDMLAKYHVTDPNQFYGGVDFWQVPSDPTQETTKVDQPAYYLSVQMPGQTSPAFSLTTTFVPVNRDVLAGFLAVDSDAGSTAGTVASGYGSLRLLSLPKQINVMGPAQVQNEISSSNDNSTSFNTTLSQFINLNRQQGSTVTLGNLLTLPVGGGLLYVQPIYVQANTGTSYPLSKAIVTVFGSKLTWSDSLSGALDELFGAGASGTSSGSSSGSSGSGSSGSSGSGTTTGSAALAQALAAVQAAYDEGQAALKNGDFAAYGAAQAKLADAIQKAIDLEKAAGVPVPSSTPSGTATSSPSGTATSSP